MSLNRHSFIFSAMVGILSVSLPFLIWRIFFSDVPLTGNGKATLSVQFDTAPTQSMPPVQRPARLRELFSAPIHSLAVTKNGKEVRFYEEATGRTFAVDLESLRSEPISEERLENLLRSWWSPSGTEVIAAFNEQGGTVLRFFDFRDGRVSVLPETVRTFAFSPDGTRLVTLHDTSGVSRIMVSGRDGTDDPWLLMTTRLSVISVFWPHPERIIVHASNEDGSNTLLSLNLSGVLLTLLKEVRDLETTWSPDGDRVVASYRDPNDILRTVVLEGMDGRPHNKTVSLPLTIPASKCAWSPDGTVLGCGIPSQASAGDTVMTYHLGDAEPVLRYQPPKDTFITVTKPLFSSSGLVFVNGYDKKPYLVSW